MSVSAGRPAAASSRLHHRTDIRAVFAAPGKGASESAVVRARARGDGEPARWTVVAGRKVGNAVRRNRAKRRLREVLRAAALPPGVDLVAIARPATPDQPWPALVAGVDRAVRTAVRRSRGDRS